MKNFEKHIDEIIEHLDLAVNAETKELASCFSQRGCDWCLFYEKGACKSFTMLKKWLMEEVRDGS